MRPSPTQEATLAISAALAISNKGNNAHNEVKRPNERVDWCFSLAPLVDNNLPQPPSEPRSGAALRGRVAGYEPKCAGLGVDLFANSREDEKGAADAKGNAASQPRNVRTRR